MTETTRTDPTAWDLAVTNARTHLTGWTGRRYADEACDHEPLVLPWWASARSYRYAAWTSVLIAGAVFAALLIYREKNTHLPPYYDIPLLVVTIAVALAPIFGGLAWANRLTTLGYRLYMPDALYTPYRHTRDSLTRLQQYAADGDTTAANLTAPAREIAIGIEELYATWSTLVRYERSDYIHLDTTTAIRTEIDTLIAVALDHAAEVLAATRIVTAHNSTAPVTLPDLPARDTITIDATTRRAEIADRLATARAALHAGLPQ